MKKTKMKLLSLSLALAMVMMAVAFSGCIEEGEGETLVVGTTDSVATLDPADCYDYFSSNVLFNTVETLISYEPGTTEVTTGLAKDYQVSDDGLVYTFQLEEGVKFHDGSEMTSSDVKFSLERARDMGGDPGFLLENIDRVEEVNDYEVKIHLNEPSTPFLTKLGYTVAAIVSEESYDTDDFKPTEIVGTGPYELEDWQEGTHVKLKEFDDYWGDQPYADDVTVKLYGDSQALKNGLETDEIDVAYRTFTPTEKKDLMDTEGIQTKDVESPEIRYIVINVQNEPFDDKDVRQAVANALDRQEIADDVYDGDVEPLYSMIPNGMWSHESTFKDKYGEGANLEEAKNLLEKAGYSEDDKMDMTLYYTPSHYGDLEDEFAQVFMDQLEATGMIDVELQSNEWGRYSDDMVDGNMGCFLLGWYPDYFDPDDYISPFLTTSGAQSLGSFYDNETMNEMIEEEQRLIEQSERTPVFKDIQEQLADDAPYIPVYQGTQFAAFNEDIDEESVILGPVQIFRYYLIKKDGWER
ncbi:MAG: ABC transporter substrate-binding protein [Thermoplasmatota archaeon]